MKDPKILRLAGFGILVLLIAFGVFYFSFSKKQEVTAPVLQTVSVEAKKMPSITTKTYIDDVGFQFDYPDDLNVVKKESTNSAVYTDVGVSSKTVAGSLSFIVEDTKEKKVDDWIGKNINSTASAEKAVTLGNIQANVITQNDKTIIVAIDQGVLFKLEVTPEGESDYWNAAFATVLSNFSFSAPQAATSVSSGTSGSSGGEDVVVEEDIIE